MQYFGSQDEDGHFKEMCLSSKGQRTSQHPGAESGARRSQEETVGGGGAASRKSSQRRSQQQGAQEKEQPVGARRSWEQPEGATRGPLHVWASD